MSNYRLVFAQPDAENGERVCVGLLFTERDGRARLLYDRELRKLRCLSPSIDLELVRFFLDDFDAALRSDRSFSEVARGYSPHLITSEPRAIKESISDAERLRLLNRYTVAKGLQETPVLTEQFLQTVAEAQSGVSSQIREYLSRFTAPLGLTVIPNARPHELFGRNLPNVGAVALGVTKANRIILIDGVDLRTSTARRAVDRANKIVHTFWQYGRYQQEDFVARATPIERIGIVINGSEHPKRKKAWADAHDYALDQFRTQADLAVDSESEEDREKLTEALAS